MKKMVFILLLFINITAIAQDGVILVQKNGSITNFTFTEAPIVSYTERELILSTSSEKLIYAIDSLENIYFSIDKVNSVLDIKEIIKIQIANNKISIENEEENSAVVIFGVDGKIVRTFKVDEEGKLEFCLEDIKEGIYVIKTKGITYKFLMK